jgi:hypothetical protein
MSRKNSSSENTLSDFIMKLSNKLGYSFDSKSKDNKSFNPFSVNNSLMICALYTLLNNYTKKLGEKKIIIPSSINIPSKTSIAKVKFSEELNEDLLDEVIDEAKLKNISIIDTSSIEIDLKS